MITLVDVPEALQEMILKFESRTGCHIENLWTNWGAQVSSMPGTKRYCLSLH